ncbi:MAG: hypothetical protein DPW18_12890 [Chloroflexi bacterium]|nr:hypothetical protein [Chloroflexota bacterium]MDL1943869.1 hypothetical protein [Chloroflexi bacterium CFX2]
MDNRLTLEQQDALIEDALSSQPLTPMPRSITTNVMSRIKVEQRPTLITWNDFVIALVIALTIGAVFITYQSLPPVALAKLRIQAILLYQGFIVNARWLVPALFFGLAALFAGLSIPPLLKMTVDNRR